MIKTFLFQLLFILVAGQIIRAQEFDANQQYNQAMANAKHAFEAKQFSEAVMFYREAIKIKPDALLPKYKIEDIRTIYIKKELDAIKGEPVVTEKPKPTGKSKKEIEIENAAVAEVAKAEASRKMNEDADLAEAELRELRFEVIEKEVRIETKEIEKLVEIKALEHEKELEIKNIEPKSQSTLEVKSIKNETTNMDMARRDMPEAKEEVIAAEPMPEIVEQVIEPKPNSKAVPQADKPKNMDSAKTQEWVEEEKKRLVLAYPNKKTVEEIDKQGKHITRVIMNIDNKVTIYLKVSHSWGAIFYFVDEVGLELRSINEPYFNTMTNLKTYGN